MLFGGRYREIYFRTRLAYELTKTTGVFGYRDNANLPGLSEEGHTRFIKKCEGAFNRSREPFAIDFKEKYGDAHALPPYWTLVNLVDFGMMLMLYRESANSIRKGVAADLGVSPKILESWLVCLNTVRNMAAHHGGLWNRRLGIQPTIPRRKNDVRWHEPHNVKPNRMFEALTVLSYLLERIAPGAK